MEIKFTKVAEQELDTIYEYISNDDAGRARKQTEKIYKHISILKCFPNAGMALSKKLDIETNFRSISVYPWVVVYEVCESHVEIVHIVDGRRDYASILFNSL